MDLQNHKDYEKYEQYHLNISNAMSFLENGVHFSEISLFSNFIAQSVSRIASQKELHYTKWIRYCQAHLCKLMKTCASWKWETVTELFKGFHYLNCC